MYYNTNRKSLDKRIKDDRKEKASHTKEPVKPSVGGVSERMCEASIHSDAYNATSAILMYSLSGIEVSLLSFLYFFCCNLLFFFLLVLFKR